MTSSLGAPFAVSDADRAALVAAGNPEAASLNNVRFFVNDFDTTTTGLDLVGSLGTDHFGGDTTYSVAVNFNDTEVDDFTPGIISEARVKKLEESLPKTKGYFSVNHQRGPWHINARLSYYGSWYEDHLDSDVVLFLIGMRFNRPWKIWRWWQVFIAMPRMLQRLKGVPVDIGTRLQANTPEGQPVNLTVVDLDDSSVTVDANHPLAGRDLVFDIELVEVIAA